MIRKISGVLVTLIAAFAAVDVLAAGTSAGTTISNTATVTYSTGGGQTSVSTTNTDIKVQELINVSVVSQNAANVTVSSPDTVVVMRFDITNTGNGDESFIVSQANVSGDSFDATLGTVYLDDGDGVFEPGTDDIAYDNNAPVSIQPDQARTVWATADIPANQKDADFADVQLSVLSKTFSDAGNTNPQAGDTVAGQGTSATDAVAGTSQAREIETARYLVTAIEVTISKAVEAVRDNLGQNGNKPVPGAEVDYLITVNVSGSGTATGVSVSDPLPAELRLKGESNGVIIVNGENKTAQSDDDNATYDANTNTITVNFDPIKAGSTDSTVKITTIIQ